MTELRSAADGVYFDPAKTQLWLSFAQINPSLLYATIFTKRLCLGITNGFLDFLGIACPFTLRFKLLMREIFETEKKKLSWEDQIPESMVESWKLLVSEAVLSDGIFFPRCVRPTYAMY